MIPVSRQNSGCFCLGVLCMHARLKCPNLRCVHEMTKVVCMHATPCYAYPDIRLDPTIHFAFMYVVIWVKYLVTRPKKLTLGGGAESAPTKVKWDKYIQKYHYNIEK